MVAKPVRLLVFALLFCSLLLPAALSRAAQPVEVRPSSPTAALAAQVITQWTFEGNVTTPSTGSGVASAGSGLSGEAFFGGNGSASAWSFSGWTTTSSIDANDYFQFAASTSGFTDVLFSFDERRSGTGIRTFEVHYSTDGSTFTLLPGSVTTVPDDTSFRSHSFDLSSVTGLNDNPNATFRIYGYNAEAETGTWRIDNVTIASNEPEPDLVVAKSGPTLVQSGSDITYTLGVTNTGNVTAAAVVLTDTLPAGFTYVSDTSGIAPTFNGQQVVWSLADFGASEGMTFELVATTAGTGTVTNTLTASTSSAETDTADNTATAVSDLVSGPITELAIAKSGPLSYQAGDLIDYTIVITVSGAAAENVVLSDTLPAGTAYVSDTTGVTPTGSSPLFWSLGTLTEGTYSYTLRADSSAASGSLTNTAGVSSDTNEADLSNNSASSNAAQEVLPIGTVQGAVSDSDDGHAHRSPFAPASGNGGGATVTVQGVIYQMTLARTSSGGSNNGFFLQNTAATADGDPTTSDGIFVFMGRFTSLIGGYVPEVGDEVIISGRAAEFFNMTQLSSASLVELVRGGVDIESEVAAIEANPPLILDDANRYWERHEGMRMRVPSDSIVIGARDVFSSTADGEVWVARGDVDLSDCASPYAQRVFRDVHPCDNNSADLFDDGNGHRILMASHGIKATLGDNSALINPGRIYDSMINAPAGGLNYSFNKYMIEVSEQPDFVAGIDPSLNAPPQAPDRSSEYSIGTYNVENLYDFRDDPFDGCDFADDSGCPGVNPPFDYVPASEADYQAHLDGIAAQIIGDLHSPDILLVQEAEDQDFCSVVAGAMSCGSTNNADGKPDTLQELALVIAAKGGPSYDAALDRDGADDRGIVSGFLYRTDRVELLPATAVHAVLGSDPLLVYRSAPLSYNSDIQNPKALNAVLPDDVDTSTGTDGDNVFTRPPQVGLFRVWVEQVGSGGYTDLYAISNHFSSGPDRRVGQRAEQANYVAAIVEAIEVEDPAARVAAGGDFNVFPRPDDPFAPGHPLYPTDQLVGLYEQGLLNLYDVLLSDEPASAYGYGFQGQTQTLDQVFVTEVLIDELVQVRVAHINADWPAEYDGDGARGVSDHDPQVARFAFPAADLSASLKSVNTTTAVAGDTLTYTLTLINAGAFSVTYQLSDTLDDRLELISAPGMTADGQVLTASDEIGPNSSVEYLIVARIREGFGFTITNSAELSVGEQTLTLTAPSVLVDAVARLFLPLVGH